jgi:hypothetical protein
MLFISLPFFLSFSFFPPPFVLLSFIIIGTWATRTPSTSFLIALPKRDSGAGTASVFKKTTVRLQYKKELKPEKRGRGERGERREGREGSGEDTPWYDDLIYPCQRLGTTRHSKR